MIGQKTKHATLMLLYLAKHKSGTLYSCSKYVGCSLSYMEQIASSLSRAGLVTGTRGPGGGYALSKPSAQITMSKICLAVEKPARKPYSQLWDRLTGKIHIAMSHISLVDVLHLEPDNEQKIAVGQ